VDFLNLNANNGSFLILKLSKGKLILNLKFYLTLKKDHFLFAMEKVIYKCVKFLKSILNLK